MPALGTWLSEKRWPSWLARRSTVAEGSTRKRTAISLFVDDTYFRPPGDFARMMDFCEAEGVRGKVSIIPGQGVTREAATLGKSEDPEVVAYMAEMARADARGFDLHMELMTHNNLWDFQAGTQRNEGDGPHESVWLKEPGVSVAEYEAYFGAVLDNVRARGVTINGLTVPGCACESCQSRRKTLRAEGHARVSDNAWQALLNMAGQDRFGGPIVSVFVDEADADHPTRIMLQRGGAVVYDARVDVFVESGVAASGSDADFYITADGRGGCIPDLVLGAAQQCFICVHWYSMNPTKCPENWATFQEIVRRINATLGDRVEWVRPSEYGARLLKDRTPAMPTAG